VERRTAVKDRRRSGTGSHTRGVEADAHDLRGVGLSMVAATAFGTVAILAKKAYEVGADALPLLGVRYLVASVLLVLFVRITRRRLNPGRRDVVRLLLLGGVGYAFESALFFVALELAPAGVVSLIFFSYPLLTALLSYALRIEPIRRSTALALVLGSIGVASIFTIENLSLAGPLLALAAAFAVAVYFVAAGYVMRNVDPAVGATWTAIGASASLLVISVSTQQSFPSDAVPPALMLGAVTAVAFTALYSAIARIGAARSAVAQMLEPVVTVVLSAIVLAEAITVRVGVGAALVVASLPLLASAGRRDRPPAPPPDTI